MKKLITALLSLLVLPAIAMAQVPSIPISSLPTANPIIIQPSDYLPILRNGSTWKAKPYTFPASGSILLSGTNGVSLNGLTEIDGYCPTGLNGAWAVEPCITGAAITGSPSSGELVMFATSSSLTNGNLTGDITTSNNLATTLATVNSNIGSFGSSTSIPNFTANAKGLLTAAGSNAVIAPAGTLTGTTLNSTVVTSSLTTIGTIGTGTWAGTTVAVNHGGTGVTTSTGTGNVVLSSTPTLVTPVLGAATATSLNFGGTTLSTYQTGTWIPTDASGASLSLTVSAASYTKIGRLVILEGNITYPSTASGSNTSIGGLPYPSNSTSSVVYVGQSMSTYTTNVIVPTINSNVSVMGFNVANGATAITNANLSLKQVYFTILYEASTN